MAAEGSGTGDIMDSYTKAYARTYALYTILARKARKKPDQYLFIGRNAGEFAGNTKYLFLHFAKHVPQVSAWYLTQHRHVYQQLSQAHLPVLFFPSQACTDTIVQSGTVVVESISFRNHLYYPLIADSRQIQLWHGVGNKKIGFQLEGASCLEGRDQTLIEDHSDYDTIVSTSPFYTDEVFRKSMHARQFVSLGYPRTDIFFREPDKNALLGCDTEAYSRVVKARKKGPVILYAPTFRDTDDMNPLTQNVLPLEALFDLARRLNAHVLLKPHTRTRLQFSSSLPDNATLCASDSDIYPFLPMVDMMITDYSSIHTEYLLLDRPILFFWADFDSYMSKDRGFQFPFEDMCPGPKCRTGQELLQAVADAVGGVDEWKEQRRTLRDKAFSHVNGGACERITELLVRQAEPESNT